MNEKLKILASKISPNVRVEFNNPQECYDWFRKYFNQRKDFFQDTNPEDLLKIIFYVYSLKTTGGFEWAEKVSNNLQFIRILYTDLNPHEESCNDCGGDGRKECDECDGTGRIDCHECGGDGVNTCSDCEGSGQVEGPEGETEKCGMCSGTGEMDCEECDGEGRLDCDYCSGGEVHCDTCDGNGELESDTYVVYQYMLYCSWSKILNEKCELDESTPNPISNSGNILKYNNEVIELSSEDHVLEPRDFVESGDYYCVWIDDSIQLKTDWNMQITTKTIPGELDVYGQR